MLYTLELLHTQVIITNTNTMNIYTQPQSPITTCTFSIATADTYLASVLGVSQIELY